MKMITGVALLMFAMCSSFGSGPQEWIFTNLYGDSVRMYWTPDGKLNVRAFDVEFLDVGSNCKDEVWRLCVFSSPLMFAFPSTDPNLGQKWQKFGLVHEVVAITQVRMIGSSQNAEAYIVDITSGPKSSLNQEHSRVPMRVTYSKELGVMAYWPIGATPDRAMFRAR
jgi:hypothetical protein